MLKKCPYDSATSCECDYNNCLNCLIKKQANMKDEIIKAFIDVIDGHNEYDIQSFSGLNNNRSLEIYNLWKEASKKYK